MTISLPIFTRTQTAETTPFDGASVGLTSTNLQEAISELALSGAQNPYQFDYIALTADNIASKSVYLSKMPAASGSAHFDYLEVTEENVLEKMVKAPNAPDGPVFLDVVGGTVQYEGEDFILVGDEIRWEGLGLDGLLDPGDILRVMHPPSAKVTLDVVGGTLQEPEVDYAVSGRLLSWDGLGLDGLLEEGDILRVLYPSDASVEFHTFTNEDIAAGEFELGSLPAFPELVMMDVVGGAQQYPGLDFYVEGQKIVFRDFNLQTLVEPGDVARIIYQSY